MSGEPIEGPASPSLEARWPILLAVLVIMTLTAMRPAELRVAAPWVLPAVELVVLVALVVAHPARTGPRSRQLRAVSIVGIPAILIRRSIPSHVAQHSTLVDASGYDSQTVR